MGLGGLPHNSARCAHCAGCAVVALLLAAAALLAAALAWPAPGSAAERQRGARASVEILSPEVDAEIGRRVTVRVRARGPRFNAMLNGRDITRRFHRRGSLLTARLRLGRDYRPGDVSLLVSAGRGARPASDLDYYYAVRRRDRSTSLGLRWNRRRHAGPLLRIRTRRPIRSAQVWLNGRRVEREFRIDRRGRRLSARLAPHAGLRYGSNRVVVRVVQRGGVLARLARRFHVRRGRPLADTGRDRRIGTGEPVMLDSTATLPDSRSAHHRLHYRWRVLQAPPGSRARPQAAVAPRTRFVPDAPGTYVVGLTVSDEAGARSLDEARINAPQTTEPMGLPIQTRTKSGAVQIGSETFGPQGSWVQMLVLDDHNATAVSGPWGPALQGFSIGESAKLLEKVRQTTGEQLVILSGQCCSGGANTEAAKNLTAAIEFLGGTVQTWGPTPNGAEDLWQGLENHWSLIGHAGLTRAAADQNFTFSLPGVPGVMNGEPGQPGSLNGYLQIVSSLGYEYVSPENVALDTKWTTSPTTPPSNTQNTIAVGSQHYQSSTIAPNSIAIQLLLLDPSTLQLISNETFQVIEASGQTAWGSIYFLDKKLHEINTNHALDYSPLIILQDFGKREDTTYPGRNSSDWIQDTLPRTTDTREWSGNHFPNSLGQLKSSWNEANVHGFGSVAGNLGILVSPSFHDTVANYRRPYFDNRAGRVVPRVTGGLTMVAEPHLYQISSAFGQGQSDPALSNGGTTGNGRVTGTLTRNEQSQWELGSPASNAGFELEGNPHGEDADLLDPEALWDIVFQPAVPWPCSPEHPAPCPRQPGQIAAADRYIAARLFGRNTLSVREMYTRRENWSVLAERVTNERDIPFQPGRGFSRAVFTSLTQQFNTELDYLGELATGIESWQNVIAGSGKEAYFDMEEAASAVLTAIAKANPNAAGQSAEINAAATTSDGLYVAASIIELALAAGIGPEALAVTPPALGGLAAVIALGEDLFGEESSGDTHPSETQELVADDTALIRDKIGNLGLDLRARYDAINATMGHFEDIFATDWGKLTEAAEKFRTEWALDSEEEKLVALSFSVSGERQLYYSTLPSAYSQWILSPEETELNGEAALEPPARNYGCRSEPDKTGVDGNYVNAWEPAGAETAVQWTGAEPPPHKRPYTVRMLKQWTSNLQTGTTNEINEEVKFETYVPYVGANPPEGLVDPLFEPVAGNEGPMKPKNLGMSKDAYFGQTMVIQQLQCGVSDEEMEEEEG